MITAFIPVKKHSTRLPNKNFRPLNGKSIVERLIEWCKEDPYIDEIVLATDASVNYPGVIKYPLKEIYITDQKGPFVLTSEFAKTQHSEEIISFMQSTAPFRLHSEFKKALERFKEIPQDFIASCYYAYPIEKFNTKIWKRQNLKPSICPTGTWRIGKAKSFAKYNDSNPPLTSDIVDWFKIHALSTIDIDNEDDWEMAELIAKSWDQIHPKP